MPLSGFNLQNGKPKLRYLTKLAPPPLSKINQIYLFNQLRTSLEEFYRLLEKLNKQYLRGIPKIAKVLVEKGQINNTYSLLGCELKDVGNSLPVSVEVFSNNIHETYKIEGIRTTRYGSSRELFEGTMSGHFLGRPPPAVPFLSHQ